MKKENKIYIYTDENGNPLYKQERYYKGEDKSFYSEKIVDGNWIKGLSGVRRVLYKLPMIIEAIKKAQKVFKEAFLRDDINRKETINILNRYREISKIKDKNEYIKAVYEEGKKNFGLEFLNLKLSISKMDEKNVVGSYNSTKALLKINEKMHRKDVIDTLHHELRHVKQDFLMANYSPKEFASATMWASGGLWQLQSNNERSIEAVYTCYFNNHGITRDSSVVPQKLEEYVKKLIKAQRDYVKSNIVEGRINQEYYNNFKEVDARNCGESISNILKWFIFWK